MSSAVAVIGASYGDEGKGLMTDYLCAQRGPDAVIRFNGGAQAGHTVVTPEGRRHVFSHYGSGTFAGVPTFLSKHFISNPILFCAEAMTGRVMVDPRSLVTTPVDMVINQALDSKRGHGTCGVGINETMQRSRDPRYAITVSNMLEIDRFQRIMSEYVPMRLAELGLQSLSVQPYLSDVFFEFVQRFLEAVEITSRPPGRHFIFEGAQGLKLDQNSSDFPHVTHSNTGMLNVREISSELGILDVSAIYVTRGYLTRHGAGPLPGEVPMPNWVQDITNVPHPFQGLLRYAPLDVRAIEQRVRRDAGDLPFTMAVTHLDQVGDKILDNFTVPVSHVSHGPSRTNVFAMALEEAC